MGYVISRIDVEIVWSKGEINVTYDELKVNAVVEIKEKPDEERAAYRKKKYIVAAKYPSMCILEDSRGRRRGVSVGELIMNKVITQSPYFERIRREKGCGWRKKSKKPDQE